MSKVYTSENISRYMRVVRPNGDALIRSSGYGEVSLHVAAGVPIDVFVLEGGGRRTD